MLSLERSGRLSSTRKPHSSVALFSITANATSIERTS
jgi:hypothetical protein